MTMNTRIAERSDGVYQAWCPALPGCRVLAHSKDEAHAKLRDAIAGYLSSLDVALPRELARRLASQPS
jgi:predicted RNase H-like HicB family nuclease